MPESRYLRDLSVQELRAGRSDAIYTLSGSMNADARHYTLSVLDKMEAELLRRYREGILNEQ